jgi:ABC-type multidrug transport system fused ATPase/permease subunit
MQNNALIKDIKVSLLFMKKTGVRVPFFIMSFSFSLGLVLFNLYAVALLFPLVQGIINSDFSHVKNLKIVGTFVKYYPDLFSSSVSLFILLVLWVYLNTIFKNILQYLASISIQYQAKDATVKMRDLLFNRCLSFGKGFYDKNKIAYIHSIVTQSTKIVENQFKNFQGFILEFFLIIMYTSLMLNISWKLTLISFIFFPTISIFIKKIIVEIQISLKQVEKAAEDLNNKVFNILNCLFLVKGFVKEDYEFSLYKEASKKEIDGFFKMQKIYGLIPPVEDIGSMTGLLLLAFGMALVIYIDHSIDPTKAFVFFYLAQKLNPSLNSINKFKLNMINSSRDISRINELLEKNEEHVLKSGDRVFDGLKKGIEIKNLNFSYAAQSSDVLKNLNFYIPKGKITAIIGPTGSGKSTLVSLLMRFYDCPSNSIFIDGVDIKEFDPKTLRSKISSIAQDNIFLNDTIKHNILYGAEGNLPESYIKDINESVLVHDFVDKMSEKYETVIGEKGTNLSGGEKQRISLARSILKKHDIFIMDEGTSALDGKTEQRITDFLDKILKDKTRIIISHRLSTIKKADNIIYLEHGMVKESGTLDELLSLQGEFYKQWIAQKI